MTSRQRGRGSVPPHSAAASTPVAAVTPTLAISSGLLNDVTESEDEMENALAASAGAPRPAASRSAAWMAAGLSGGAAVSSNTSSMAATQHTTTPSSNVDLIKLQCQVQQLTGKICKSFEVHACKNYSGQV